MPCINLLKTFEKIRLVYFGSELKPTVGKNVMTALEGQTWSENIDETIFSELEDDLDPIDNLHGSAALKMHWQKVLTKRAIALRLKRRSWFDGRRENSDRAEG